MTPRFQSRGALRPNAPYCTRPADLHLLEALRAGRFCHVLAPRQMGKSSLCKRTQRTLKAQGWRTADIDLNLIGTSGWADVRTWTHAVMCDLAEGLGVAPPRAPTPETPFGHILTRWLLDALRADPSPIALFIDELDLSLRLPFPADDLFAALRALHDLRASQPALQQVTFCLVGVATPDELIRDVRCTPFNVSEAILLEDFTREEAQPLVSGFEDASLPPGLTADRLLDATWSWTAGHPYQTHALCAAVLKQLQAGALREVGQVEAIVDELFRRPPTPDDSLQETQRRLQGAADPQATLRLYQRVLTGDRVLLDRADPTQNGLLLSGAVSLDRTSPPVALRPRNRILVDALGVAWVTPQLRRAWVEEACERWNEHGQRDADTLRGGALQDAREWLLRQPVATPRLTAFLDASARVDEAARWQRRERTLRRRLLLLLLLPVIGGAAFSLWAYVRESQARGAELAANATRLASTHGQGREATLAALSAFTLTSPAQRSAITDHLTRTLGEVRGPRWQLGCGALAAAVWRGTEAWVACDDGAVLQLDPGSGAVLRRMEGHQGRVHALAVTKAGDLVSGSADGTARLWLPDGPRELTGHGMATLHQGYNPFDQQMPISGVWQVMTADDRILTVAADLTPRLWDLSGAPVGVLEGHTGPVTSAAFSPDAATLATVSLDGTLRTWSAVDGTPKGTWQLTAPAPADKEPPNPPSPLHVAWSPDGRRVAAVTDPLWIVDTTTGPPPLPLRLTSLGDTPTRALWSDELLVISTVYGPLLVLDAHTYQPRYTLTGPGDRSNDLRWSAAGHLIAAVNNDTLMAWTGVRPLWTSFTHEATTPCAAPSPDGELVLAPAMDGTISVLRTVAPGAVASLVMPGRDQVSGLQLSPDDELLVLTGDRSERHFQAWRVDHRLHAAPQLIGDAHEARWLSNGEAALIWTDDPQEVRVVDPTTGAVRRTLPGSLPHGGVGEHRLVTLERSTATLWSFPDLELVARVTTDGRLIDAQLSPDGARLALIPESGAVQLVDAVDGGHLTPLTEHTIGPRGSTRWSPDGRLLATFGTADNDVALWDTTSGALLSTLRPGGNPGELWFLPGDRLLTITPNRWVRLWQVDRDEPVISLHGNALFLRDGDLAADGRRAATVGDDGSLILWDTERGEQLGAWVAGIGVMRAVAVGRDGYTYAGGDDGVLRMFPSDPDTIVAHACSWLPSTERPAVCP